MKKSKRERKKQFEDYPRKSCTQMIGASEEKTEGKESVNKPFKVSQS